MELQPENVAAVSRGLICVLSTQSGDENLLRQLEKLGEWYFTELKARIWPEKSSNDQTVIELVTNFSHAIGGLQIKCAVVNTRYFGRIWVLTRSADDRYLSIREVTFSP
jgi:hypothetical protein